MSRFRSIDKAGQLIKAELDKKKEKRNRLREEIYEKYPEDIYGIKAEMLFDEKRQELDKEIALLRKFAIAWHNTVEMIEEEEHDAE